MPLFGAALFFLIPAFCFCLKRNTLILAVALLVIGLLLIILGVRRVKEETKRIQMFVREKSVFYHKYCCHFFVANNDTPDCPEAESYSRLFIRTVYGAGMAAGSQYLLDIEYGAGLEQRAPDYIQAVREGFTHDKNGVFFGFRLAYDTQDNVLHCAEAVIRIIWHKSETLAIYSGELLKRLFFEKGR